jgi:tol-pal system protein YbgF
MLKRQHQYLGLEPLAAKQEQEKGSVEQERVGQEQAAVVTEDPKSKELTLYDDSLASFKEGRYEAAMDGFESFLKRFPKSDRADNAQFWIGESYMALKQYEEAILEYQKVIKKYRKGNKVPNAMLRQAVAFLEIKDKMSSKLLLKKIIKNYPKSNEAKIAGQKLKALK